MKDVEERSLIIFLEFMKIKTVSYRYPRENRRLRKFMLRDVPIELVNALFLIFPTLANVN